MRTASQDYGIIVIDDKFIGIALGYDYCAEHEWGIEKMRESFGIPKSNKDNLGIKNRTITKCVDNLIFKEENFKGSKCAILYTGYRYNSYEESLKNIPYGLNDYKNTILWRIEYDKKHPSKHREPKDSILTAWDESSFGIGVIGEKEVGYLKELYEALKNNNVSIAFINLMPKNPFSNSSLTLLITDRVPQEALDGMYAADKEYYDREEYEENIGMKKIIKKHGNENGYNGLHYFIACSPKWIDYKDSKNREKRKKELKTKYDIQYWINYSDDDDNHGWYTVEQIKEWLTGNKKLTEIVKKTK